MLSVYREDNNKKVKGIITLEQGALVLILKERHLAVVVVLAL